MIGQLQSLLLAVVTVGVAGKLLRERISFERKKIPESENLFEEKICVLAFCFDLNNIYMMYCTGYSIPSSA